MPSGRCRLIWAPGWNGESGAFEGELRSNIRPSSAPNKMREAAGTLAALFGTACSSNTRRVRRKTRGTQKKHLRRVRLIS